MGKSSQPRARASATSFCCRQRRRCHPGQRSDWLYRLVHPTSIRCSSRCHARCVQRQVSCVLNLFLQKTFCDVLSTGLRPYADSCGANRALWQDRFDAINALSSTEPPPPIKTAFNDTNSLSSLEDRYRNLFPLSLPRSMFQGSDIQSPAASTPSAQSIQSTAVDEAALHDTHSMRAAYIEHTTRRKSSVRIPTVRGRRFQE